jgi:TolA-binding protein
MTEYANHNYAAAAAELRKIGDANPGFTPARFYLGISLLLANDRIAGIQELNELASAEDDPYLERARFYLAKALIGEHDLPRAQQQLKDVIAQHGQLENQAAALLNQILQT